MNKKQRFAGAAAALFLITVGALGQEGTNSAAKPSQPSQPQHGPGSSETTSHSVVTVKIADGGQGDGYFFRPIQVQAKHLSSSCVMDGRPSLRADTRRGSVILSCEETSSYGPTIRTTL